MDTGVLLQQGAVAAGAGPGSQSSGVTSGPQNLGLLAGPGWAGPRLWHGDPTPRPRHCLALCDMQARLPSLVSPTVSAVSCAPAIGCLGLAIPQILHTSPPSPGCHHVILSTCNAHHPQPYLTKSYHPPKLSSVLYPPRNPSVPVTPGVVLGEGPGQDLPGKVTMTTPTPQPPSLRLCSWE